MAAKSKEVTHRDEFRIPLRYMPQAINYDDEMPEAEWHRVERTVRFEASLCALVMLDTWNTHFMQGRRTDRIVRDAIKPVADTCRKTGMLIIHAPSPPVAAKYPEYRFKPTPESESQDIHSIVTESYVKNKKANRAWPTFEMRMRTGSFSEYSLRSDRDAAFLSSEVLYSRYYIHPALGPEKGDWVIADRIELDALLTEKKKYHLFYAGFVSNGCVQERDYGVKFVQQLGYNPILLRDCTTALEMAHTFENLEQTRASVENIEFWVGTTTSGSFLSSLRDVQGDI
jgi:nicotinamidase-related amidase